MRRLLLGAVVALFAVAVVPARAQDAVKVDPKHYKVEFENEYVRIVRATFGKGARAPMQIGRASCRERV